MYPRVKIRLASWQRCEGRSKKAAFDEILEHGPLASCIRGTTGPAALSSPERTRRLLFACLLFAFSVTRLLVNVNRSVGHRRLLSELSRGLPTHEKKHLIRAHYQPCRESVAKAIEQHVARGQHVSHISPHSFTPVVRERTRNADIGLLYDPRCLVRMHWAKRLHEQLAGSTGLRVRRKYHYHGASDGFVTSLTRQFMENVYSGLETELNQRLLGKGPVGMSGHATGDFVGILSGSIVRRLQIGSRPAQYALIGSLGVS